MKKLSLLSKPYLAVLLVLMGLVMAACGGSGTYSPTVTTTGSTTPVVGISIVNPSPDQTTTGGTLQYKAIITGTDNKDVVWSIVTESGGSINSSGLYTAPGTPGTYTIKATSVADPTKSATTTVSVVAVVAPITLKIVVPIPDQTTTQGTLQFTSVVTGTTNTAVQWLVVGDGDGTISSSGLYTAPTTPGTYTIEAISVADSSVSTTTTVTVVAGTGGIGGTIQ